MTRKRTDPSDTAAGFTLIEVLVALAIAGIGIAALVAAIGTGLGNGDLSSQYIEATRRAESRLAMVGIAEPLAAGQQSGDDGGGYSWHIQISLPLIRAAVKGTPPSPALYDVDIDITWLHEGRTRSVSLRSQRIGPAPAHG